MGPAGKKAKCLAYDEALLESECGPGHKPTLLGRGRSSGVEHNLAKVRVARSNRVARSKFFQPHGRPFFPSTDGCLSKIVEQAGKGRGSCPDLHAPYCPYTVDDSGYLIQKF